jgi:hypothetical protein
MEFVIGILIFLGILIASVFLVMKSATDLLQQANTPQQQPPLNNEKDNSPSFFNHILMISNSDLPHQPRTIHEPSLVKKNGYLSWIGFFIALTIFHLLFGLALVSYLTSYFITLEFALTMTLFLLALVTMDYIATMFYLKKRPPPWKVIFIPLLFINTIFILWALYLKTHHGGTADLSFLGIIFLSVPLAFIDFIAVFFYIGKQRPQGIVKVISYTVFIPVSFVLAYLASSAILFWLMGHIDYDLFSLFPTPVHTISTMVAIVSTFLLVLFLRHKFHK